MIKDSTRNSTQKNIISQYFYVPFDTLPNEFFINNNSTNMQYELIFILWAISIVINRSFFMMSVGSMTTFCAAYFITYEYNNNAYDTIQNFQVSV